MEHNSGASEFLNNITNQILQFSEYARKRKYPTSYRSDLAALNTSANLLLNVQPSIDDFHLFIRNIHDALVVCDTYLRSLCYRIIRLCLKSEEECMALIIEDVHFFISSSLELNNDYHKERSQALKIVAVFLKICPRAFPLIFARSIVAICGQPETEQIIPQNTSARLVTGPSPEVDELKPPCLELLCELCYVNIEVLSAANGIAVMIDVILDPDMSHLQESYLLTLLHALSKPTKRKFLRPNADFRLILSPYSCLDFSSNEQDKSFEDLRRRWNAAKSAFILMMRTHVGAVQLCSDELAFPFIVNMLQDPNVPVPLLHFIVDSIQELFEPFNSKFLIPSRGSSALAEKVEEEMKPSSVSDLEINPVSQSREINSTNNGFFKGLFSVFSPSKSAKESNSGKEKRVFEKARSKSIPEERLSVRGSFTQQSITLDRSGLIYNITDNYCAFLCCAFIHSNLLNSLCFLAVRGSDSNLIRKSRVLLTDILRAISKLFPENFCSDLLILPSLIEFSASHISHEHPHWASRAEKVLQDLNTIFSVSACKVPSRLISTPDGSIATPCGTPKAFNLLATLFDQVRLTSQSKIAKVIYSVGESRVNSQLQLAMKELKLPQLSALEFDRHISSSKIEKEKTNTDPLTWDWGLVNDIVFYNLNYSRISDTTTKKWLRNLYNFFKCNTSLKKTFATLDWDISNFHYMETICNLFHVLFEDYENMPTFFDMNFLLYSEISKELEGLFEIFTTKPSASSNTSNNTAGPAAAKPKKEDDERKRKSAEKNIFRTWSCLYTMSREYFTILGRLANTAKGEKKLSEFTSLFDNILRIGDFPQLDYLSRLVITSLMFSDRGLFSKQLFSQWIKSENSSQALKNYLSTLLGVLLQSRPADFYSWGYEVLIEFITAAPSPSVYEVLELACQDSVLMQRILEKLPKIDEVLGERCLIRIASTTQGIGYLTNVMGSSWLSRQIQQWRNEKGLVYVDRVELLLSKVLRPSVSPVSFLASPITVDSDFFAPFSVSKSCIPTMFSTPSTSVGNLFSSGIDKILPPSNIPPGFSFINDTNACAPDLEGLLRCPWSIEVTISKNNHINNIKVDTFLDVSSLKHGVLSESRSDANRIVKVRGIVLNDNFRQEGHVISIAQPRVLKSALLVGTSAIQRDGTFISLKNSLYDASASVSERSSSMNEERAIDVALTKTLDNKLFDWCICDNDMRDPKFKRGEKSYITELENGLFSVEKAGDPIVWVFARKEKDTKNVYLVEIQYLIRIKTGQAVFTPLPRHLFGELAQSTAGCDMLYSEGIISDLVTIIANTNYGNRERIAAMWAIGKICTSDNGFAKVTEVDPDIISWMVTGAASNPDFSIRGTLFQVLGQISRSKAGCRALSRLEWDYAAQNGMTAVSVPKNPSILFDSKNINSRTDNDSKSERHGSTPCTPASSSSPASFFSPHAHKVRDRVNSESSTISLDFENNLRPDEAKALDMISKLCGTIYYSSSKDAKAAANRLRETRKTILRELTEQAARKDSGIFRSRNLYQAVCRLLEVYSFQLETRRGILDLFDDYAKLKCP